MVIYFCFPYYGDKGLQLLESCMRGVRVNCKSDHPVVFKILYDACIVELFRSAGGGAPVVGQSFAVCGFACPG